MKNIAFLLCLLPPLATATQIYAHRGGAALVPENTQVGLTFGTALGADVVDFDVVITKDGHLIAYHDLDINAETTRINGQWSDKIQSVSNTNLNEIQKLDVGCMRGAYQQKHPERISIPNLKILSLEEVFKHSAKPLQIEIKSKPHRADVPEPHIYAKAFANAWRKSQTTVPIEVHSFHWPVLFEIEKQQIDVTTSYITSRDLSSGNIGSKADPRWTMGLGNKDEIIEPELIAKLGGKIWCPRLADVTAENILLAHKLGLKVNVWTVNKEKDMRRLIEYGVDGIITDRPDILLGVRTAFELTQ